MKKEIWNESLNHIDEDIVENYVIQKDNISKRKKVKRIWIKWSLTGACACLALVLAVVFSTRVFSPGRRYIVYSAQHVGELFNSAMDGATNSYQAVYVPSLNHLKLYNVYSDIPSGEDLAIYEEQQSNELDKAELKAFIDPIVDRLQQNVDVAIPEYEIEYDYYMDTEMFETDFVNFGRCRFKAIQSGNKQQFVFSLEFDALKDGSIQLGDDKIEVDQTRTDEQILSDIKPIQDKLFYIFGRDFSDVKIYRRYSDRNNEGVYTLSIFFYNKAEHPLNTKQLKPVSDYIYVRFDNISNSLGVVSDTILTDAMVGYVENRSDSKDIYHADKYGKRISLEEAEELLYKGYVFGNPACVYCMQAQELVDFHDYDLVGIEYVSSNNSAEIFPFYAFYKKIGTAPNGNEMYAKTYVAAVEVTGYDEYFQKQHEQH